ncbi:hypothetical protein [Flavobacterium sp.]|uniref:hypothetical protein n=1 Tax=Flavobacterium sp. TaxID=239 RepID=UPI0008C19E82|nr:hypothetical protein [Flavobacterium sp.]OGS62640.1 MAG: hypothetical protein A2X07_10685 [Flavobacteria bacterium GWF1_32_7]HBD25248.1 hypothetical protein [Flavobacterium sp.]
MEKGQCKLCLKDNVELLTKSHIIPKFLFEDMKDDYNSFLQIDLDNYVKGRRQHIKNQRDSFHESGILCVNCDGKIIKEYEDYLKLTFHSTSKPVSRPYFIDGIQSSKGFSILKIDNLDYRLYKLGFLSILWRASISSLPFFKSIDLGPHSEVIRKMILNGDALQENNYPFITSIFNRVNDDFQIVLPITKFKLMNYVHYRIIINGLDVIFMIGSKNLELASVLYDFVPNNSGKMNVIMHKKYYAKNMMLSFVSKTNISRPKY